MSARRATCRRLRARNQVTSPDTTACALAQREKSTKAVRVGRPAQAVPRGRSRTRRRARCDLLAQGEVLKGELPVAAQRNGTRRSRWSSVLIIEQRVQPHTPERSDAILAKDRFWKD